MNKNIIKTLILLLAIVVMVFLSASENAYADQYGDTDEDLEFDLSKKVRFEGDSVWRDRITGATVDDLIEFRIRVKNIGEDEADDMKIEDYLPDEMYRVGGSGLTEYWDNFKPGDTEEFIIEAKIEKSEFDRDYDFDKCITNEVDLTHDGDFIDDDDADVCYGEEPEELPEAGFASTMAITGASLIALGSIIKRYFSKS